MLKKPNKMLECDIRYYTCNVEVREGGAIREVSWDSGLIYMKTSSGKTGKIHFRGDSAISKAIADLKKRLGIYTLSKNSEYRSKVTVKKAKQ